MTAELEKVVEELERTRPLPRSLLEILAQMELIDAPAALIDTLARGAQSTLSKVADGATLQIFYDESGMEISGFTLHFGYSAKERLKVYWLRNDVDGKVTKVKRFEDFVSDAVKENVRRFFEALIKEVVQ